MYDKVFGRDAGKVKKNSTNEQPEEDELTDIDYLLGRRQFTQTKNMQV